MIPIWTVTKHNDSLTNTWHRVSSTIVAKSLKVSISFLASPIFFKLDHIFFENLLALLHLIPFQQNLLFFPFSVRDNIFFLTNPDRFAFFNHFVSDWLPEVFLSEILIKP